MVLHTVNKSPFSHCLLEQCLQVIGDKHALLLLEDGVYAALTSNPAAARLLQCHSERALAVYALAPDLRARGLLERGLLACVEAVSYADFVRLAGEYDSVQSWF